MLIKQHVKAGHKVKVLASTEVFDEQKKLIYTTPRTYVGAEGAEITRIGYASFLPHKIMKKLRIHNGVYQFLTDFSPDVIMFHSMCGWELRTVCRYAKDNSNVKLYMDSHEDLNNSARSFISKHFLHGLYYRPIAKKASGYARKVLCISLETMTFMNDFYGINKDKLEFYPLGGEIKSDLEYRFNRKITRDKLKINHEQIVFFQSGKLTKRKKLIESVKAFIEVKDDKFIFLIAGLLDPDVDIEVRDLIDTDCRIKYLGWQNPSEIENLLDATDVYLQPGTQSVTMQASLCARCTVVIDDVVSHEPYLKSNGWFANDSSSIKLALKDISDNPCKLTQMSKKSFEIAKSILDYEKLAARILK